MQGEYRKVTYEAVATDVRIQGRSALSVDMNSLVVDFKAFGKSGDNLTVRMSTLFAQGQSNSGWQSWELLAEAHEKWNVGDDWRAREVGTLENLSERSLFKRSGQKYNDEREYIFRKLALLKSRAIDEAEPEFIRQDMENKIWNYSAGAMRKAMEAQWNQSSQVRAQRIANAASPSAESESDDIPF